jgi:hypothetical protein
VEEAQRHAGERIEKTETEKREALDTEMPGFAGIKHHITQDELSRRRLSLHQNSLREAREHHTEPGEVVRGDGAAPNVGASAGASPGIFSALSFNSTHDRMEKGLELSDNSRM